MKWLLEFFMIIVLVALGFMFIIALPSIVAVYVLFFITGMKLVDWASYFSKFIFTKINDEPNNP